MELYPPRAHQGIDTLQFNKPEEALNEEVKSRVLTREQSLGVELEGILNGEQTWLEENNRYQMFTEAFDSDKGKALAAFALRTEQETLSNMSAIEIQEQVLELSPEEIKRRYSEVNKGKDFWKDLTGIGNEFVYSRIKKEIAEGGYTNLDQVENPDSFVVQLNVNEFIETSKALFGFKHKYLRAESEFKGEGDQDAVINEMYRRRVNQEIASKYIYAADFLASELITEEQKEELKALFPGLSVMQTQQGKARMDKFLRGANPQEETLRSIAEKEDVPLARDAVELYQQLQESITNSDRNLTPDFRYTDANGVEQVVSFEEFRDLQWSATEIKPLFEKVLAELGVLSTDVEVDLASKQKSQDGKYRVIIDPGKKSFAIDHKLRLVILGEGMQVDFAPNSGKAGLLSLIDHEATHILQQINTEQVGLKILETIGMDRSRITSEAGAIAMQNRSQQEYFNTSKDISPYVTAVMKRLEGGTYKDCVLAFFNDLKVQRGLSIEDTEGLSKAMDLALDRVNRIFKYGGKYDSTEGYVTNTASLSYLEQELLAKELQETNNLSLIYLGRINPDMLNKLQESGLIDLSALSTPSELPSKIVLSDVLQHLKEKRERLTGLSQ